MTSHPNLGIVKEASDVSTDPSDFGYDRMLSELRETFNSGKTKKLSWRKQQLNQLIRLFEENIHEIAETVQKDHGGGQMRGLFELGAHKEATLAIANLEKWANPQLVKNDYVFGSSKVHRVPKGVILMLSPWNFPFELVLSPLVSAIAGGNCVVIKPSEVSPHSSRLVGELIAKYLDPSAVRVVQGEVAETTALLQLKWDHIFYTGNGVVGRVVTKAAAKNLTPVTLELGGKSPTIIDETVNLDAFVERFTCAKYVNVGQVCISPDFLVVDEKIAPKLKKMLVKRIQDVFGEARNIKDYGRIINGRHLSRVKNLIETTTGTVIYGGEVDESDCYIGPTLIENPSFDDPIIKEEIFGPVTPILTFKTLKEAVDIANSICNEPLVLYIFSENQKNTDYILNNTISGGVNINSFIDQNANLNVPFGGFGESGMGNYHGKFGFDELTHPRTIVKRDTTVFKGWLLPPPPYPEWLFDIAIKKEITGFLTPQQKNALKVFGALAAGVAMYTLKPKL